MSCFVRSADYELKQVWKTWWPAQITVCVTEQAESTFEIKIIKLGLVAEAGDLLQTQGQPGLHSVFQVSQNYSVKK